MPNSYLRLSPSVEALDAAKAIVDTLQQFSAVSPRIEVTLTKDRDGAPCVDVKDRDPKNRRRVRKPAAPDTTAILELMGRFSPGVAGAMGVEMILDRDTSIWYIRHPHGAYQPVPNGPAYGLAQAFTLHAQLGIGEGHATTDWTLTHRGRGGQPISESVRAADLPGALRAAAFTRLLPELVEHGFASYPLIGAARHTDGTSEAHATLTATGNPYDAIVAAALDGSAMPNVPAPAPLLAQARQLEEMAAVIGASETLTTRLDVNSQHPATPRLKLTRLQSLKSAHDMARAARWQAGRPDITEPLVAAAAALMGQNGVTRITFPARWKPGDEWSLMLRHQRRYTTEASPASVLAKLAGLHASPLSLPDATVSNAYYAYRVSHQLIGANADMRAWNIVLHRSISNKDDRMSCVARSAADAARAVALRALEDAAAANADQPFRIFHVSGSEDVTNQAVKARENMRGTAGRLVRRAFPTED